MTTVERQYNSATGKYELPDPWEGAPKGIRVVNPYGTLFVHNEDGYAVKWPKEGDGWMQVPSQGGLAYLESWMDTHRREIVRGNQWPDFDGAPEGFRVYYKTGFGWAADVITPDGGFSTKASGWRSRHKGGYGVDTPAKRLAWYRATWPVIVVDEVPAEPENDQPKATFPPVTLEDLGPQVGDVIRNTDTGATWYLDASGSAKQGRKLWKQVGNIDLRSPSIVDDDEFALPANFRILSRAVAQ